MTYPVTRRTAWISAIETIDPSLPGADPELFEFVAHQLDRFHSLDPFARRDPAFRILDSLAAWARVHGGQGSPYERVFQQLWDPVQRWGQTELVDLFPGEAAVLTSLPLPRFLCVQKLGTEIAVLLYHPPSWALAGMVLTPEMNVEQGTWSLIHGMEKKLITGWVGPEMSAWIVGGKLGEDEERLHSIRTALREAKLPDSRIEAPWSPRSEDDGSISVVFDRTGGHVQPFHPGFDSVHYNLRTRRDRERCRVESLKETPTLLWPFEEVR